MINIEHRTSNIQRRMWNRFALIFTTNAFLLLGPKPVMANQPPGPHVLLAEVLILFLMILLSVLGGAYVIVNRKKKRKYRLLTPVAAFLAIIISGAHEGLGVLVAIVFGIYALDRAFKMVAWGVAARSSDNTRTDIAGTSPWRLITTGVLLIIITVFLTGMAVAFVGFWPMIGQAHREQDLKKFVAYHMAYTQWVAKKADDNTVPSISADLKDIPELKPPNPHAGIEYSQDRQHFTAHMLPTQQMPFFPYNYLTSQPSYRADETGDIRMIRVHRMDHLCPEDAPVVMKVESEHVGKAYNNLIEYLGVP